MWRARFPGRGASLQRCRNKTFSHLAIRRRRAPGRDPGPAVAQCQDRMRPAMMLPATTHLARRILLAIAVLAASGVLVSCVSLYHHYGTSDTSYCDIGQNFNCDIVNRSTYSTIAGIPVALIGIIGYVGVLTLATFYRHKSELPAMLAMASLAGLGLALYLTYIEGFILATWCILCLSSLALIFSIAVLSSVLWRHSVARAD